jgi:hypothetical protein
MISMALHKIRIIQDQIFIRAMDRDKITKSREIDCPQEKEGIEVLNKI